MEARAAAELRTGSTLLALGAAPFAAGAVAGGSLPVLPCPFRAATGLPCPLCGASRAFVLAADGDAAFLRYGAVWVALAALAVAVGLVALAAAAARRPLVEAVTPRGPRAAVTTIAAAGAVAWAWALAHSETIAG